MSYPYQVSDWRFRRKEYNFKKLHFVVLMVVDFQYRFMWARCGYPANSYDAFIFQSTNFYQEIAENFIITLKGQNKNGVDIQPL